MSRILTADTLPYWIVGLCLILGLAFPTTGLVVSIVWGLILACAVVIALFLNHRQLNLQWLKTTALFTGLIAAVPSGLLTIRWWLPLLGDLLRVQP